MDIKELLQIDLETIHQATIINDSLRTNIKQFLIIHKVSKEELLEVCELNQDQYYRRLNNPKLFSDSHLILILSYVLKKSSQ